MRLLPCLMLLAGPVGAAEPLAAVRICFSNLGPATPLFLDHPERHYRALGSGTFVLDFDLTLDEQAPTRLSRVSSECLRAWLPARPVNRIEVRFERTATNLLPSVRAVKLKLLADKWSDGGTMAVSRGAESAISTDLPGQLTLARVEEAEEVGVKDLKHLATGRYVVRYRPPPPPHGACPITLVVEAGGTVRLDNHPDLVAQRTEYYRSTILPSVLSELKESCTPQETLEVRVRLWDGVFIQPRLPERIKSAQASLAPSYAWLGNEGPREYRPGTPFDVGYGEHLRLAEVPPPSTLARLDR